MNVQVTNFRSHRFGCDFPLPADTYTALDVIATAQVGLLEQDDVRRLQGRMRLATFSDTAKTGKAMRLLVCDGALTHDVDDVPTAFAANDALSLDKANAAKVIGFLKIEADDWTTFGDVNLASIECDMPFVVASGTLSFALIAGEEIITAAEAQIGMRFVVNLETNK